MNIICTVDILTRHIALPAGVQIASYDHNVDVIQFNIEPIEDFSLNTSSIKIAAQGPNKARHDYAVDPSTVSIEEETGYITFDWPIPQGVTEMPIGTFKYGDKGNLIFSVCAEIIDGSTVSQAWHSDDGIITVVAHLEPEAGGGEDPEEEATNAQKIAQLQTDVAVINTQVGALGNGSPNPVATVAEMTDESAVYLYTGSETGYTAGNWYYYDGTAWTSGGTYGGATTSTTFDQHGVPADDFAVGEALAEKADSADVTSLGTRVTAVEDAFDVETHVSENLLNAEEIETGCYYWTNGKNTNASYNSTPLIPVTSRQTLWFQYGNENAASRQKGYIRFAVGYNADGVYVSGSEKGNVASYTVPNGVSYVRFSINFNTLTEAQKPVIIAQDEDIVRDYIPYFAPYTSVILKSESDSDQTRQNTTDIEELRQQISGVNSRKAIFSVKAASVNANANLICCDRCDNKKNEYIELTANFATFGNLTIAHGKDAYMGGYITITSEKILVYSYNGTLYEEFTHGLTLSDFINVIIYTKNINTCRSSISIMSSGGDYTAETTRYYSCRAAVLCNADFAMTNVEMRYTVNDAAEDVWVFGDSYISLGDPNRWANQMMLAGHKNALLCGYGGAKSRDEILSFRNLIAVAKPQYVVWTLGMNDGDSSTAINAEWKTYADEVIATCENNGVVPILATIPNVPNIIHTFKNTYVRESGKRYVDFAKAVNAESAGASWYTGMLSSDNTHPTALGAKALMRQFLLDVPEVLYAED